jgi:subtilisin family serine protease
MNSIFHKICRTFFAGLLLAGLWCMPAHASGVDVRVDGARFSLEARDADMADVLEAVATKAGIRIAVAPGVKERVTVKLSDLSLEALLERLCANRTIVYRYIPEMDTYEILQAGAYTSDAGSQTGDAAVAGSGGVTNARSQLTVQAPIGAKAPPADGKDGSSAKGGGDSGDENPADSQGRLLYKPRELLVRFKADTTDTQKDELHRTVGAALLKRLNKQRIDRVRLPNGITMAQGLGLYGASPAVDAVERHALRYPLLTPNDPSFTNQWAPPKIKLPETWDTITGSPRVIVAVIDTGVDYNHPDLAANIWINPGEIPDNGLDDDRNGFDDDVRGWDFAGAYGATEDADPMDRDGHGTHVAGIIGAIGDNETGVAGAAWKARLMALKVQADSGTTMESADIIQAIDYAIAKGARIVNCSFGGKTYSKAEFDAFTRLRSAGILAVCAAGNDGRNIDPGTSYKTYPANYNLDNIIAVAASDQSDNLWTSSNYGAQSVHLMAPGVDIYSTWASGATSREICRGDSYCNLKGTSMATPHVAGVAALMWSKAPALTYSQIKAAMLNTVDPIAAVSTKLITGGRLNAAAALSSVRSPGDLNNDGRIDLADALLALRILAELPVTVSPGPLDMKADVNADGLLGLPEALYALQWTAALRGDNRAPVLAVIGNRTVNENSTLTFTVQATDPDHDVLIYAATDLPAGAQFNPANRTFIWTPTYSQSGAYRVTFIVTDGFGGQDRQTITITVNDRTPVFTVAEYFPLTVGDWWDYIDGTAQIKRTDVTETKTINGTETKVMAYADGQKDYYRLDGDGLRLYGQYVQSSDYTGEVFFDAPIVFLPEGAYPGLTHVSTTTYTITVSGYLFHVDLTSTTTIAGVEDLVVGTTLLPNCIQVTNQINQSIQETGQNITGNVNHYWFARGIGRVKSDTQTLVSATISGELKTF